ncbi:conserved hypothetical protein [Trichinella spiralis]|uniref:hypothetical protein n=1 Tax=Trichinella spiralis TaxID=6334 RepID=UPI0001EFD7A6|nr:conserved hypothetical protein [Trichinella spiralis]
MSILGNLMVKHPIFGQPLMENNHPINDQSSVANQVLQIIQPIIDGNWPCSQSVTRESPIEGGLGEIGTGQISCKNRPGILYVSDSQIPRPVKLARQPGRVVDCIFRSSWPTGGMVSQAGDDRNALRRQERTELKCEYGNNEPQRNELPKIL